jgi:uncharacterized protein YkwD
MRRGTTLVAFVLLALGAPFGAADDKKPAEKFELAKEEKAVLELTNKARAAEKLPPLTVNEALFRAARKHTANMAKQGKLEHELDGKRVGDRADAEGYDFAEIGENVAAGEDATPEEVVDGWLKSKGHRENLLNKDFTEIGLGVVKGDKGEIYYTQVFGKPRKK